MHRPQLLCCLIDEGYLGTEHYSVGRHGVSFVELSTFDLFKQHRRKDRITVFDAKCEISYEVGL